MEESLDEWFKREILVLEPMLMRFLARAWSRRDEWVDIRQEVYVRVYTAAQISRPRAPKAFLFSTARNLMTDKLRRERIVSIRASEDSAFLDVLVDEMSPERLVSAREELRQAARAFDRLSDRCRQVLWMRRVKELPQKEVAATMGLAETTVEKYLRIAVQRLADLMSENRLQREDRYRAVNPESEIDTYNKDEVERHGD